MGGSLSGLSRQLPEGTRKLTFEEKQGLEAFLTLHNTPDKGCTFNTYLLQYLTATATTGKSKSNSPARRLGGLLSDDKLVQADSLFALARLDTDEDTVGTVRRFVESICVSGLAQFWSGLVTGSETTLSVGLDGWVVDWVLVQAKDALERIYNPSNPRMQYNSLGLTMLGDGDEQDEHSSQQHKSKWQADAERVGGVGIEAWRAWWSGNDIFRELTCMALRNALSIQNAATTLPRDFVVIRGVAEANLTCPRLPPEICTSQWLSFSNNAVGTNTFATDLLTPSIGWTLTRELPAESRKQWERVYSSRHNGLSWNTFLKAVERCGSLILLIRERAEKKVQPAIVLGAYIDSELERGPSWHGTSQNFLFSVCDGGHGQTPLGMTVYRTSGFNDHYQYLNYSTKTLPNGLGVGGQMGHFGLWIDSGFTRGGSNTAATFSSPQLSTCDEFSIDMVEAWLVRPSQRLDSDGTGGVQKSVVEANPEAAAILEMANRPMHSTNLPQHRVEDANK